MGEAGWWRWRRGREAGQRRGQLGGQARARRDGRQYTHEALRGPERWRSTERRATRELGGGRSAASSSTLSRRLAPLSPLSLLLDLSSPLASTWEYTPRTTSNAFAPPRLVSRRFERPASTPRPLPSARSTARCTRLPALRGYPVIATTGRQSNGVSAHRLLAPPRWPASPQRLTCPRTDTHTRARTRTLPFTNMMTPIS